MHRHERRVWRQSLHQEIDFPSARKWGEEGPLRHKREVGGARSRTRCGVGTSTTSPSIESRWPPPSPTLRGRRGGVNKGEHYGRTHGRAVAVITGCHARVWAWHGQGIRRIGGSVRYWRASRCAGARQGRIQKAAGAEQRPFEAYSCEVLQGGADARHVQQVVADFGKVESWSTNAASAHAKAFGTVTTRLERAISTSTFDAIRCAARRCPECASAKGPHRQRCSNIGAKAPGADSTPTSVSRAAWLAPHQGALQARTRRTACGQSDAGGPDRKRSMGARKERSRRRQDLTRSSSTAWPGPHHRSADAARPRSSPNGLIPVLRCRTPSSPRPIKRRLRREPVV